MQEAIEDSAGTLRQLEAAREELRSVKLAQEELLKAAALDKARVETLEAQLLESPRHSGLPSPHATRDSEFAAGAVRGPMSVASR